MTQTQDARDLIADMIASGTNPDTAGQRTWPNWKVADALRSTSPTPSQEAPQIVVRPCLDATGQHRQSWDICYRAEPGAKGSVVIASCYGPREQAEQIAAHLRSTSPVGEVGDVSTEDAVKFLETALRNWETLRFDKDDLEDVREALQFFAKQRLAASDTEAMRLLDWEELSIADGQQVSITFKDPADAFALFNELKSRAALAKGGAA